jgi:hypothetical protein
MSGRYLYTCASEMGVRVVQEGRERDAQIVREKRKRRKLFEPDDACPILAEVMNASWRGFKRSGQNRVVKNDLPKKRTAATAQYSATVIMQMMYTGDLKRPTPILGDQTT